MPRPPGDLQQFFMQRVPIDHPLAAGGVFDELRTVQGLDGLFTGTPGGNQFPPPRKTRHQMRLDESGGDLEIRVAVGPVDVDRGSAMCAAKKPLLPHLARAVIDHTVGLENLLPDHRAEFVGGAGAMQSGGHQQA